MMERNMYYRSLMSYLDASTNLYIGTIGFLVCLAACHAVHLEIDT